MKPKIKSLVGILICFFFCALTIIVTPIMAVKVKAEKVSSPKGDPVGITIWQIDGFEGGKGSRASFLKSIGEEYSKKSGNFVEVKSLSADSARLNAEEGNLPDLISFTSGFYGFEDKIKSYKTWCRGGYCILTISENADFSDINEKNTVINGGTDNLSSVCAILQNLGRAEIKKPTGAYISLINGEYKYLLGTQRDIFRLRTRGVAYKIQPVTIFNDLYQNISVICTDKRKVKVAEEFLTLLETKGDISKLGTFKNGKKLYDDDLSVMENIEFDYKLISPISKATKERIDEAIRNFDAKTLKTLFK